MAPPDGEPRFTSITKRAPGRASAALRLRRVGSGSRPSPASRAETSTRLRATISARIPSATTCLDEQLEPPIGFARLERLQRQPHPLAQVAREPGGEQQGAGVERHDL